MPTDSRIVPGPTPAARSSSSLNCRCVVLAGWMTRLLASPTLARCDHSERPRMKSWPASRPPWQSNEKIAPAPSGRYFSTSVPVAAGGQARVGDVRRQVVRREELGDRARVGDVAIHAQRQRLEPLQEEEGVERAHRRAQVAQRLGPQLHQVAVGAERLVELQAVIGRRRLGDRRDSGRSTSRTCRRRRPRRRCWCRARR